MRQNTLVLIVLIKMAELLFFSVYTLCLILSLPQLYMRLDRSANGRYVFTMAVVAAVMVFYHTVWTQLLTNLRFKSKTSCCFCCGYLLYDVFNFCFCSVCTRRICDEKKDWWYILKWAFLWLYFGLLIYLIRESHNDDYLAESLESEYDDVNYEALLCVFIFHQVLFIAARPFIFVAWSLLMCCCHHGSEFDKEDNFDWSIISFNYVRNRTAYYNSFEKYDRKNPQRDIEFKRQITAVRKTVEKDHAAEPPSNVLDRMRMTVRRQAGQIFQTGNELGFCPICSLNFLQDQKICQLPCHPRHILHEWCYANYTTYHNTNQTQCDCPICRIPINQQIVQVKQVAQLYQMPPPGYQPQYYPCQPPMPPPIVQQAQMPA